MEVEQLYTDCLAQATYYVESNGEVAIIDPLRDYYTYIEKAKAQGHKIKYIFETHFHADFVSGHIDLANATGAKIIFGPGAKTNYEIVIANDNQVFELGNINIKALHTPGHTLESTSYLVTDENGNDYCVFTGDTLFIGDVGRPDLLDKNSDLSPKTMAEMLYLSINNKLKPLNDRVIVYPAHGSGSACGKNLSKEKSSTIGTQKLENYAMSDISKEDFVKSLLDGIVAPPEYFFNDARLNKTGYSSIDEILNKGFVSLETSDFKNLKKNGTLIIDSRNPLDFESGFIPGSVNIGLNGQFAIWAATLFDLDRKIILVCDEGNEKESIIRLARVGFDNIAGFIKGGIKTWIDEGNEIDLLISVYPEELGLEQKHGKSIEIIDVRKPSEFENGYVDGAINFSLAQIQSKLDEIDKEKNLYLYCQRGYRSVVASSILKANGFVRVNNVYGGYEEIKNEAGVKLSK
ncbi:MAG: MBL fold metallo-hydrolase [Bacteroidetes bacterium]|nr:MBL fold metallo-hydrolase [Bacteroidota bacterium]